jgi:hypothetical protein
MYHHEHAAFTQASDFALHVHHQFPALNSFSSLQASPERPAPLASPARLAQQVTSSKRLFFSCNILNCCKHSSNRLCRTCASPISRSKFILFIAGFTGETGATGFTGETGATGKLLGETVVLMKYTWSIHASNRLCRTCASPFLRSDFILFAAGFTGETGATGFTGVTGATGEFH